MTQDKEIEPQKKPIHENFLFRIIVIALIILGLYYLMSPYQNCSRYVGEFARNAGVCIQLTSW